MKKLVAATALMAATMAQATAQVLIIETENGQRAYDLTGVRSVTFSDTRKADEMITMEVANKSALAFDLKVTKAESCQKWMATVTPTERWSESAFIASAQQTLQTDAYFRPFKATLSYESATYSERELGLNTFLDADDNMMPMTAAIYAIDDLGNTKVYTQEFTLPSEREVTSDATAEIAIDDAASAYNKMQYSVQCDHQTAKVIYAVTTPSNMKTTLAAWLALSDEQRQTKILSMYLDMPLPYSGEISQTYNCTAGSQLIIFAIPIDREGRIGKMATATWTAPQPVMNGAGEFTGVTIDEQTTQDEVTMRVTTTAAQSIRYIWASKTDWQSYKDNLKDIFLNDSKSWIWTQAAAASGATELKLPVVHPGNDYYLWGVTIDANGRMSEPANMLAATGKDCYTTAVIEPVATVSPLTDFDGKGECDITITKFSGTDTYSIYYDVVLGANCKKVMVFRIYNATQIKSILTDLYLEDCETADDIWPTKEHSANQTGQFIGNITAAGAAAFVTVDNDGKLRIDGYCKPNGSYTKYVE